MVYCRFCAKEKPSEATINFITAAARRNEVIEKLSLFSNNFVDFDNKILPECICETCCKSLEFSYEFFVNVKASQVYLEDVFLKATSIENAKEETQENDERDYETQFEGKF